MLRIVLPKFRINTQKFHSSQTSTLRDNLILVDESDNYLQPIQKIRAHQWDYIQSGKPHRAFSVFLFDNSNRLLMQRRSKLKILFPLLWTNSCCSHPLVLNQDPLQLQSQQSAIRKRVPFQLGVSIDNQDLSYIDKLVYKAQGFDKEWGEYEVDSIYFSRVKGLINYNKDEVEEVQWVKVSEIDSFVNSRQITPWFKKIYEGDLKKWWNSYTSK